MSAVVQVPNENRTGNTFIKGADIKAFTATEHEDGSVSVVIETYSAETYSASWPAHDKAGAANFANELKRAMSNA